MNCTSDVFHIMANSFSKIRVPYYPSVMMFSECLLLIGTSPVTILQSTFVYPMAGVMYLKQVEGEDVQMWGNMFWVNGMGETIDHNWHIHRFAVSLSSPLSA